MAEQAFVARERELAQLQTFLDRALAGHGQVCFVTGEAGAGKTALVTEFARRAQAQHDDLLVAIGDCNAQTGIGDPYLPFREVLGLLTGDVEAKLAQGAITSENAGRLCDFVRVSGQALVEYGPDLIDIFVPGGALATRVAGKVAQRTGWLDRLEELTHRQAQAVDPATHLDQGRIFEQYTAVLKALATQRPLILVVDDLQWADTASIGLLFHLGRRLQEGPILLVGAYRPDDVALGRGGERHPLDPVLNELKRYYGDVWIDLGQGEEPEGRQFVDALLDSEPNRFGETFRQALYQHTGGHPLFTVELLRNLQERGDVIQDGQGRWVERPHLDWSALPARIEGVIEERIGRLEAELREALTVASVEGEDFTAQVVARVQALNERELVRRLTQELDRQHRLVQEQGVERVGGQRLSLYRFRHNLFQRYLYNHLGETEREFLHEDVGSVLEELYGDQAHEIAVQLAEHFLRAGLDNKALTYLIMAGDAAARQYANAEAVLHYTRALDVSRRGPASSEQLLHLYAQRGRALELSSQYEAALRNYEEMETIAGELGDRALELAALIGRATIHSTANPVTDAAQGQVLLEKALTLAHQLDDRAAEAKTLWLLMLANVMVGGDVDERIRYGEQALSLARELNLREQMAFALHDLWYGYGGASQWARAAATLDEARTIWQDLGNQPMLAATLVRTYMIHLFAGNFDQAIEYSDEAFHISRASRDVESQALSRFVVGLVYLERGQPDKAIATMQEAIDMGEQIENVTVLTSTRADLGWTYGLLGAVDDGLALARLALTTAEEKMRLTQPLVLAILVRLHVLKGDLVEAEAAMTGLEYYRDVKHQVGFFPLIWLYAALAEGGYALATQDHDRTIRVMNDLGTDLRDAGIRLFLPDALYLKGRALLAQKRVDEARDVLAEARTEAEALGLRRALWPILTCLSEIEVQRGNTTEAHNLRRQSREIVEYIADHAGDPALRASFLSRPDVRAVVNP